MPGLEGEAQIPGISTLVTPETSERLFGRIGYFSLDSNESSGF